jgi:hypothetical protein
LAVDEVEERSRAAIEFLDRLAIGTIDDVVVAVATRTRVERRRTAPLIRENADG